MDKVIETRFPAMIHDFLITEKYAIIPENPALFKPEAILKNEFVI